MAQKSITQLLRHGGDDELKRAIELSMQLHEQNLSTSTTWRCIWHCLPHTPWCCLSSWVLGLQ